jgi:pimeloyl-ACP methyl ester carboxylesterase
MDREGMIPCLSYKAPGAAGSRVLLVMLPGAGMEAAEFAMHGMVDEVQARGLAIDIVATRPDLGLYLDGSIAEALHRAVVEPARAQGYTRIWLLGISLGGMGVLLHASTYEGQVEGLVLLAPFLGTPGTIAEVRQAGGLAAWSVARSAAVDTEKRMLVWLQNFIADFPSSPALYLGCGSGDRFAPGHRMLAEPLPEAYVVTEEGGHDWETWRKLWQRILDRAPFATALDDTMGRPIS